MADYKEKMSQSSEEAMRLKLLEEFKVKEGIRRSVSQTLDNLLWKTLNLSDVPSPVRIMDFGGGTGELKMAISQKMEILHKELIISVEEPHKEYLDQYRMSVNFCHQCTSRCDIFRAIARLLWAFCRSSEGSKSLSATVAGQGVSSACPVPSY
ncbi:uncharacterized protein LOC106177667 isoform X2 [Lingula anatina]|uniref:Uncharacterized protein LOC106177667 isoform X2 n=1 Tax=Lingula anatina TaxID=7574 RepID=A0A1S3K107_LINAN|nr:uncharacterized protein LOC106177667 isoform X2 [Lingula anatina]|eukprot:XP_013415961.1 uncharacterized protein LOC106177667 isoform X2 [Lingula anatina]